MVISNLECSMLESLMAIDFHSMFKIHLSYACQLNLGSMFNLGKGC